MTVTASTCARCGAPLAPDALACGACRALVHAPLLQELADHALAAEAAGDLSGALGAWRQALDLLPSGTVQAAQIQARVVGLSERLDGGPEPAPPSAPQSPPQTQAGGGGWWMWLLGAAALAWKGKFLLLAALSKGKVLLLGLTKLPTLLSMFLTIGLYGSMFGWKLAAGFVVSIYIHEMGHVVALRRYGIAATAPMFVPGLGAFIRLKQYPATPVEDANTGLAGPLWGLGAAIGAIGLWLLTGDELWAAVARLGAWVNLFNLVPVWQLDGGRGWRALDQRQRWLAVGALVAAWVISSDVLLLVIAVVGAVRAATQTAPERGSSEVLARYAGIALALAALLWWLPDPMRPR